LFITTDKLRWNELTRPDQACQKNGNACTLSQKCMYEGPCHQREDYGLAENTRPVRREKLSGQERYRLRQGENEHQVAIVAALFHDLGKIWTNNKSFRPILEHSFLCLEILAPRLAMLDAEWRSGADMLRHMLVCPHDNRHDSLVVEEAIRYADRASAGLDARQQAFANEPSYKSYAKFGDRRYCRSQEFKQAA
jgi:hypothetical protein